MKRKIWKWIFSIFIVVVLVSLATVLVLRDNKKEEVDDDTLDIPNSPSQESEVYATSFSCNIPENIVMIVGTEVHLKSGYITTVPAEAISKMTYEIELKSNGASGGIEFKNDVIRANKTGTYEIKFKIPKSESSNFNKTIEIVVNEDETNGHIYQTNTSMIIGESKNINDLFSIKNENYSVETDSKVTLSNNVINPILEGESEIKFTFTENYVKYIYNFKINIEEQPIYQIILKGVTDNTIEITFDEETSKHIEFKVVNREQGDVEQLVDAVSSDESVVHVISYTEPFIKIEALKKGEATITISYLLDPTIKIDLKVIVK